MNATTTEPATNLIDVLPIGLSILALAVALIGLAYNLRARPVPHVHVMRQDGGSSAALELRGYHVHVYNLGRRPLPLSAVGILVGTTTRTPSAEFTWDPDKPKIRNPTLPAVVEPGGVVIHLLPASAVAGDDGPVVVRVRWISRRLGTSTSTVKMVDKPVPDRPLSM